MKSLRRQGRSTARARRDEIVVGALEMLGLGQHREAGGAARGVGPGERRRIEVGADQALARRGLLDLGDQRELAPGELAPRARARSRAAAPVGEPSLERARAAPAPSAGRPPRAAGRRSRPARQPSAAAPRSRSRPAAPASALAAPPSIASTARATPLARSLGPPGDDQRGGAVEQHDVAIGPAHAVEHARAAHRRWSSASAPRRSSSRARGSPACSGVTSKVRDAGRRAARRPCDGPVVVSSSRPSAPCTTQARSEPSWPSTRASGSTQSLREHAEQLAASRRPGWRAARAG